MRHGSSHVHSPVQTIIDIEPQHCLDAIAVISLDWLQVCPVDLWASVSISEAHDQSSAVVSNTMVWAALSRS